MTLKTNEIIPVFPNRSGQAGLDQQAFAKLVEASYIQIREEQPQAVNGGTFTAGSWNIRTLNTIAFNDDSLASLALNTITLPAGTYEFRISAPGHRVAQHQLRLSNTTDALIYYGTTACDSTTVEQGRSEIAGKFSTTTNADFVIEHRGTLTRANDGFGVAGIFGNINIYTVAEFWKVG